MKTIFKKILFVLSLTTIIAQDGTEIRILNDNEITAEYSTNVKTISVRGVNNNDEAVKIIEEIVYQAKQAEMLLE